MCLSLRHIRRFFGHYLLYKHSNNAHTISGLQMLSEVCNVVVLQLPASPASFALSEATTYFFAPSSRRMWSSQTVSNGRRKIRKSTSTTTTTANKKLNGKYAPSRCTWASFRCVCFDDALKESVTNKLIISFILIHTLPQRGNLFSFLILADVGVYLVLLSRHLCM